MKSLSILRGEGYTVDFLLILEKSGFKNEFGVTIELELTSVSAGFFCLAILTSGSPAEFLEPNQR